MFIPISEDASASEGEIWIVRDDEVNLHFEMQTLKQGFKISPQGNY